MPLKLTDKQKAKLMATAKEWKDSQAKVIINGEELGHDLSSTLRVIVMRFKYEMEQQPDALGNEELTGHFLERSKKILDLILKGKT